jgi:hypothetical protein
MTARKLSTLRRQHDAYIAGVIAKGGHVLTFDTPCCDEPMTTTAPRTSETWDSLTTCPHCGEMFMKIVSRTDAVGSMPPRLSGAPQ